MARRPRRRLSLGVACASLLALAQAPDGHAAKLKKYHKSQLTSDESEIVSDKRRLLLAAGEDKTVDLDFNLASANSVIIGNPLVVATTVVRVGEKTQLIFKPLKAGETTVQVRDADGQIRVIFTAKVTDSNLLRIAGELRSLLRDVEGVEIRVVGQKVVVEGEVLVPSDYARLLTVVQDKPYAAVTMNLATLSQIAMTVLAQRIETDVKSFAPNVHTRVVNGKIFLEGSVDKIDDARRALRVATLYLPDVRPGNPLVVRDTSAQIQTPAEPLIQSFIVVNPPPPRKQDKLVRITVFFVELKKSYDKVFGFKWQPGFTADPQISVGTGANGTVGSSGATFSGTLSNLLPKLQSAQDAGYARVLKTGTVIVRSGQPAKLDEQTEFAYTIPGANGQPQGAKQGVGLTVAVTPAILGQSEDIQLDLDMKQTNLVGRAPATGTAPIVATHTVTTKLYVKSSESAAVAGVTSGSVGTDFNKDDPQPAQFSSGTDPLFTLLHSKAYRKEKSQFVIFVTPQIVENASEGTDDLKRNFRVKVK